MSKFTQVKETEDFIYFKSDYFDSQLQVMRKADEHMFAIYTFGDDRYLIMDMGLTYADAENYEEYLDEYGFPDEIIIEWYHGDLDLNEWEIRTIESYIS